MRGFTLVEVLVALVVLEVGLLGVVAILIGALRATERAWELETGLATMEIVADSLTSARAPEPGGVEADFGSIRWTRQDARWEIRLRTKAGDSALVVAEAGGG